MVSNMKNRVDLQIANPLCFVFPVSGLICSVSESWYRVSILFLFHYTSVSNNWYRNWYSIYHNKFWVPLHHDISSTHFPNLCFEYQTIPRNQEKLGTQPVISSFEYHHNGNSLVLNSLLQTLGSKFFNSIGIILVFILPYQVLSATARGILWYSIHDSKPWVPSF